MSERTVHVARQGKVLGVMPLEEAVRRLASGEFRPVDHYWMPGMADWRALSELAPPRRKPPFPRPLPSEPGMLDRVFGRMSRPAALAELWDLLAGSPVECFLPADKLEDLEQRVGYDVRRRCHGEMDSWYRQAVTAFLADRQFTAEERVNLGNLAATLGMTEQRALSLRREAFRAHLVEGVRFVLNRDVPPETKAAELRELTLGVPLPPAEVEDVRQEVVGAHMDRLLGESMQTEDGDELVDSRTAASLREQARMLGAPSDGAFHGRIDSAEAAWRTARGPLPVVDCPLELGSEPCHWSCEVEFVQNKRIVTRRSYGGLFGSTRSFMGVRIRAGSYDVHRETEDQLTKIDDGVAVFTPRRVIFDGAYKNFTVPYTKITDIIAYNNAIQISRETGADVYFAFRRDPTAAAMLLRRLVRAAKR